MHTQNNSLSISLSISDDASQLGEEGTEGGCWRVEELMEAAEEGRSWGEPQGEAA